MGGFWLWMDKGFFKWMINAAQSGSIYKKQSLLLIAFISFTARIFLYNSSINSFLNF